MSDLNFAEFYQAREFQERSLASLAIDPAIAAIHLEMAERYRELTSQAAPRPNLRPTQTG